MARSRPSFLKLRKIIGPPALRPWFLIYWFLNKEGGGVTWLTNNHEPHSSNEIGLNFYLLLGVFLTLGQP